jgi:carbon monoxide dehydrogenase subunit G
MRFDGEFRVPGSPADVLTRFSDVPRMAQCMPGASIEGRDVAGLYVGSMLVDFGPKQIRFKGKVEASTDRDTLSGGLRVRGAADMKTPARAEVRVTYALREDPEARGTTIVTLSSDAQMGGVLATFAQTGGIVVTRALMEEFAKRVAVEFAVDAPAVGSSTPAGGRAPALSAWRVVWQALRSKMAAFLRTPRKQ